MWLLAMTTFRQDTRLKSGADVLIIPGMPAKGRTYETVFPVKVRPSTDRAVRTGAL